jgi:hypothetical protein
MHASQQCAVLAAAAAAAALVLLLLLWCCCCCQVELGIRFSCSPESTALQFLDPAQTAGGKQPYLFTQCQAIHARSLVPCQVCAAAVSDHHGLSLALARQAHHP